ncbi:MAG TPA: FHA domain-containing protein [Chloroflexi bacterium]|nr:FHA domain-containing protein [Chloroflexota bacterium]
MEIIIEQGPNQGACFSIAQPRLTIGRERQCDVVLHDERISRCHVEIRRQDGAWVVYDQGSANGTWVNRRRLNGPYRLRPGDLLGVGRTIISFSRMDARVSAPVAAPVSSPANAVHSGMPFALDALIALGACLLIISPLFNWISYTILFFEQYVRGTDFLIGRMTLAGGLLSFLLALAALLLRFLLQHGERSVQGLAPYLRWIPWAQLSIGGVILGSTAAMAAYYSKQAQTEVLFGITIEDIVGLFRFSPQPGVLIAGIGFLLLLLGAAGQIASATLSTRRR